MQTRITEQLVERRGVFLPADEPLRDLVITGPPGSGKTSLIQALGGWPEEGYLDLAEPNWWRSRLLTFRPREVHFGIPFWDHRESHAVFDDEWLDAPTPIEAVRIEWPPESSGLLGKNWRRRFLFYFLLPPASEIYQKRQQRMQQGDFPVDARLNLATVEQQRGVYEELAQMFHKKGLRTLVCEEFGGKPAYFADPAA